MAPPKAQNIDEYISNAPETLRERLFQLHDCIVAVAPAAEQGIKWRMPAYTTRRILVTWAAFKNHIGFYPTPSVVAAFTNELKPYKTAEGSVQFLHSEELPFELISEMTKRRLKECEEDDAKWKV
ncbi:DUF1801 domain-containing protein [Imperialibacter roseus]|uniref:DUF1801 domain-containing protein n=1 Tax=Imperialibacter roseus TaxID=1324217 RepID=A0ABZ0IT02_9BACT|nr:DUF1801 domain-containing protein [Imperialibacter roseus]WOK07632.1 DUF1801 domain-containing protein [Imperialibacter roseus]